MCQKWKEPFVVTLIFQPHTKLPSAFYKCIMQLEHNIGNQCEWFSSRN